MVLYVVKEVGILKVWTKVTIDEKDRQVELIAKALTNYLYEYGPIRDVCSKYNVSFSDKQILDQYTANRIAGLLLLYLSKDVKRINDIANKYNIRSKVDKVTPEIEGYIER